jgi:drug/metabolite transporter (DMT)-like permease
MRRATKSLPLSVVAFCLIWSSAFAVSKIALADCPPLFLVTTRCLIAGVTISGAIALTRGEWRIQWRDLISLIGLGVANNALYLGLNHIAVRSISAGLAAIIISAHPVLTAALASIVLNERMTWRKAAGLVLGIVGVATVVQSRIATGADDPLGIAFSIGALVSFVAGTILFKRLAPNGGLWLGNAVQNLAAGLAALPLGLALENVSDVVPGWRLLFAIAYLALVVSICAYGLWFHLIQVCGASAASAYHFLMPPLGVMFGWLLLGERVNLLDLAGIVPVALGIYLVTRSNVAPAQIGTPVPPAGDREKGGGLSPARNS